MNHNNELMELYGSYKLEIKWLNEESGYILLWKMQSNGSIREVGNVTLYYDPSPASGDLAAHWSGKCFLFGEHFREDVINAVSSRIGQRVSPKPSLIKFYKTDWSGNTYREIGRIRLED